MRVECDRFVQSRLDQSLKERPLEQELGCDCRKDSCRQLLLVAEKNTTKGVVLEWNQCLELNRLVNATAQQCCPMLLQPPVQLRRLQLYQNHAAPQPAHPARALSNPAAASSAPARNNSALCTPCRLEQGFVRAQSARCQYCYQIS